MSAAHEQTTVDELRALGQALNVVRAVPEGFDIYRATLDDALGEIESLAAGKQLFAYLNLVHALAFMCHTVAAREETGELALQPAYADLCRALLEHDDAPVPA